MRSTTIVGELPSRQKGKAHRSPPELLSRTGDKRASVDLKWMPTDSSMAAHSTRRRPRQVPSSGQLSKYPPAKPGALGCEPLKAADGAADAAPNCVGHLKVAISATDLPLQPFVPLFLFLDVLAYHLSVSRPTVDTSIPSPRMLAHKFPLLLSVRSSCGTSE